MRIVHQRVHSEGQVASVPPLLVGNELVIDNPGVVDAGETGLGQHAADGAQPLPANLRRVRGYDSETQRLNGALVDHPVQFSSVGVPAQTATERVWGVPCKPSSFQGHAVEVIDVSRPMGHHNRMEGTHRVEVLPE